MFPAVYCVGVTDCVSFATRPRHVITYSDVFVDVGRRLRACFDTQLVFCHHFRPQQVRRRSETVAGVSPSIYGLLLSKAIVSIRRCSQFRRF